MTINDRKMFRQKLNPGGALVPLTMNAARQGIPKLKLLKNALIPFAIDQYTDIFGGEDLSTQEPASTSNPNDNSFSRKRKFK